MTPHNILIVDDDETITTIAQTVLKKNNFQSQAVKNGKDAITALKKTQFDAVILDIMMPKMDGKKTLKAIRENSDTKDIPVFMLTGENMLTDLAEFMDMGANDYMVKPFNPETLVKRVEKLLKP